MFALRGRLLSEYFATQVMPSAFSAHLDGAEAQRAHGTFVRLQRTWAAQLGPATSVRSMFDLAAAPLCDLLEFTAIDLITSSRGVLVGALRNQQDHAAMLVVTTWGGDLDRQWREAMNAGHVGRTRWCLAFNGQALRLIDATRAHSRTYAEFDLDDVVEQPEAFAALWTLLHARSFVPTDGRALVDRLIDASAQVGEAVCASLRHGVLDSVALVLTGLTHGGRRSASRQPSTDIIASTFEQALTIVYRVLFLLFAEAHQLVPAWHPIYRDRYTIEGLKRLAMDQSRPRGLWEALQAISRLAHSGCEAGDLRVTPFNGRLFSPSATPLAESVRMDDEIARDALMALTTTKPRVGGRDQIAYRDLGVEELGAVYETILDYRPTVRAVTGGRSGWRVELERGGHLRKESSTFYTPRALTDALVQRTLEPLVTGRGPDAILSLRVVDPAMGSGAFLVSACRYLARAYEDALVDAGVCRPGDVGENDRARFRRAIAQRCLFGVDLNPRAVQLARLSLWLATLAADCPLTFLDHHLRCGDSLVGASPDDVARQPPGQGRAANAPLPLVDLDAFHGVLSHVVSERDRIATQSGDTLSQIREKERALAAISAPGHDRARWVAVCDLWCAGWFWLDRGLDPRMFADLADRVLGRSSLLPPATAETYLSQVRAIAHDLQCFHWPLEFPEVFFDPTGGSRGDSAGFDAVIGNPPWDMIRADRPGGATDPERRRFRQITRFLRDSGVFHASTDGHANRYQVFVERALQLARGGGRIGLIVPSGLAVDRGSAQLRRLLLTQCDTDQLLGFDNRDGVFPIHRSTRFLLITTTKGRPTRSLSCRFGLRSADGLDANSSATARGTQAVRLTPEIVRRISGADLAIPELQSPLDLAIVEKLATRFPALGDPHGWNARFGRELNATDDKHRFVRSPEALPILEGKDISPFAVAVPSDGPRLRRQDAERLLGHIPRRRLAYRDVASATNRLTLIAALLPEASVSVHTLFCLKTALPMRVQRFLCAILNSFVANYLIRMRVTTHVGVGPVERLPVPRCSSESEEFEAIVKLEERLERTACADEQAYVELQARIAAFYDIDQREWSHIVSTFPLIDERIRRAAIDALGQRAV